MSRTFQERLTDAHEAWLCQCCTVLAVNGDPCNCDGHEPLDAVGEGELLPDWRSDDDGPTGDGYDEFSSRGCDGCTENAHRGGEFHRFTVVPVR